MHGCNSGSPLVVNAEVDSMGGVVDGGVGIGLKTSPRRAAIEKAQKELRQEYDVREERRRELDFLEKGGNPLDFKYGNAASVSVQSTSLTDQNPDQIVTSEAKGSFALTPSPHGDSVDSSGRPGVPMVCEPNIADNLLLFDGEHDFPEVEKNPVHPNRRNNIARSEQSSQIDGSQNVKEAEDLAIVRPYARRNRSRSNRDGARSNATDMAQNRGSTLAFRGGSRDGKGQVGEKKSQKDQNTPSISNIKSATSNGDVTPSVVASDNQLDTELDGTPSPEMRTESTKSSMETHKNLIESQHNQSSQVDVASRETDAEKDQLASAEKETGNQLNGFSDLRENKSILNEVENSNGAVGTKGLDSQSSCTKTSLGLDVHRDRDVCTGTRNAASNGNVVGKSSDVVGTSLVDGTAPVKDKDEIETVNNGVCRSHSGNVGAVKINEEMVESTSELHAEVGVLSKADQPIDQIDGEVHDKTINNSSLNIENSTVPALSDKHSTVAPDPQSKVSDKAHEDSILEEARIIEAKHKRIAELSVRSMLPEFRRKSHWDFVLEEMSWLANDFAQERLWKTAAAAQIGHRVALTSRMRFEERSQHFKLKEIAHSLAKAVMQFWNSAEVTVNSVIPKEKSEVSDMELGEEMKVEDPRKGASLTVHSYAVRFLKSNRFPGHALAEAPATPDRVFDLGIQEISWEDQLTEENLFYTIPCGAMEAYRNSIEAHLVHFEKTGSSMQEEVETSMYDAEYGYQDNMYAEEEGETSNYYLHKKSTHKKRKNVPYHDLPYGQSTMMAKRPADLNVGAIPTKRMRTASRQRVVTPSSANVPLQMKTDASSGDTNSFQDDQSTLHGGSSHFQKSVEVESAGDFDKQLAYDCAETSIKPKKKKAKHLGSAFDQGWQLDSNAVHEQRDNNKKRLESHHFDSNGTSGLYMQHSAKKPKISKQSLENTFDNMNTISGSIPSPVASHSNMSNTSKFMKLIGGGRDRGRKSKTLKIVGHRGSGSPWSLYEDQALVVLVHDMGQNWELISDAINSTLQFKCIFRKPKECKERHKVLMDKSAGDGADSAEDSGSSQPYVSTLPGIPKGSARQLFQRLQEPMEEDTLKSHFEKIIKIGQKQHYRRTQVKIENQDLKQLATVHNSHVMALSQVFPNNLNGALLTPLELSDATSSNQDVLSIGCQGAHTSGLALPNQGAVAPLLPSAGVSSPLQGSSGMVPGTSLPSPAGTLNPTIRDGRYNVPRTSSLPVEDQQRMQQYNHVLPNRNAPQSSLAVSGTDRGVRLGPGGNGMGMMSGMNRNMPNTRPAYQGMTSSSMLNSGSMLSSPMAAMPSNANMHSVAASGQGNSMIRPRDTLQMMRPGHNPEHKRQMMVPELQGNNNQGIASFNAFPNQTGPQPVPSYPAHHQPPQQHQASPQPHGLNHPHLQGPNPQAYAIRFAKERHLQQQRYMQQQQQQQQFAASNPLMPPVHHPVSSQTPSSQPVSVSPLTPSSPMTAQHPQKHHLAPHGLGRSAGAVANQMGKQRQRPPHQHLVQAGRQHPQPRQHLQSQQQAKLLKGVGRGMAQNVPVDPAHMNGLSMPQGSQSLDMQGPGQGAYAPKTIPQSSKLPSTKQHQQVPSLPDNNISANQGQVPPAPQTAVGPNHHPKQANQTQSSVQRLIQQNRQVNPDPPSKTQNNAAQAEQQPANSTSQVGADSSGAVPVSSQWKSSEPSNILNSTVQAGPITNLSGTEPTPPLPPVSQGMGSRQLSGGLPSHGHNGGTQWQPPQPALPSKQSQTLPPVPQQEQQKQTEKRPPQNHLQPQQQIQHLQAEQGMYSKAE